jgi:hypothetical protein
VFPRGDGLLALDLEDRLLALHPDGEVEVLTAPVLVAPLLSPDGARLAVAVGDAEGPSQLRILGPGDLDRVRSILADMGKTTADFEAIVGKQIEQLSNGFMPRIR